MPTTRGSRATAARRARATALNCASTMWWGSRPASTRTWRQRAAHEADAQQHGDGEAEAGVGGKRLEGVTRHRAGEVTADEGVLLALRLALVHDVGAAG